MTDASRTIRVTAAHGDVLGFVRIDSTVNGRARGGLRLMPDVTEHELELLAHAMTLKYGFLGLPQGGAKAGVIGDPEAPGEERAASLRRFAEQVVPLLTSRAYVPDSDMGTTGADIQAMLQGVGVRVPRREYRGSRSGFYTAATVFESACAAAASRHIDLSGCRVAIEGFGRVGQPLAGMFAGAGAAVVAVSTRHGALHNPRGLDVTAAAASIRERGIEGAEAAGLGVRIAVADLKFVPVEILCPCARHESITLQDADAIGAAVISCGANSPITAGAELRLWERGVLCVPDFVANSGGVLGGTMEFAGWQTGEIAGFCARQFGPRVASLLREARESGLPFREVAERFALRRFEDVKRRAEQPSWLRGGWEAALSTYRRGWLPPRLVRRLSAGYFRGLVG